MTGTTDDYGLTTLSAGDNWTADGYKFSDADRKTIARLLKIGAETHHHTGETAGASVLDDFELDLTVSLIGGSIPAGQRVFYKFTLVDQFGFESAAAPETFIDTADAVAEPGPPGLSTVSTGGTLLPGNYYYVVSAITNISTQETKAVAPAYITVPVGTTTNRVTVTFPTAPAGSTGWNVYRKKPGATKYAFLKTVVGASYSDTGADEEDCNRTIPTRNLTNASNSIEISLDGLDPLPEGTTWKIYRSYNQNYQDSLLHHVVEETEEESGIITQVYSDTGTATFTGSPPVVSQAVNAPSKVMLTGGAEVQGLLPADMVDGFAGAPFQVSFTYTGATTVSQGTEAWVCEFPVATIVGCRATLGRGSKPASTAVIVDVNKNDGGATPTFTTIYTTQANRPRVNVGFQKGDRTTPNITSLVEGEMLTVDVDQAGGGATPTDLNLSVTIYMIVSEA